MIWRQQLANQAENHTASGLLKAPEAGNTLISALNGKIQTWDATDGRLVWEWQSRGRIRSIEMAVSSEDEKDILALSHEGTDAIIRRLAADTGELLWEHVNARYKKFS